MVRSSWGDQGEGYLDPGGSIYQAGEALKHVVGDVLALLDQVQAHNQQLQEHLHDLKRLLHNVPFAQRLKRDDPNCCSNW